MYKSNLFQSLNKKNLNEHFKIINENINYQPAKLMMDEIYSRMSDIDGNFVEQFQTTGFNMRVFELFLFAYFDSCGYKIIRKYDRPDFIIQHDGIEVAIEATTVNPSGNIESKDYLNMNNEERLLFLLNELPIRFGSPLRSKLYPKNKKGQPIEQYWNLNHCKGKPFVIAIQAFFDENALIYSSSSLTYYLYGQYEYPTHDQNGVLHINRIPLENHRIEDKSIPSNFFSQPEAENVSAIIFSNSGTIAKFERMGYQEEYYSDFIKIIRGGTKYNPDPNASIPLNFSYDLDKPLIKETWGQDMVVFYNPNAKIPLPKDFFADAAQTYIQDNIICSDINPTFHVYSSKTNILGHSKRSFEANGIFERIIKRKFSELIGINDRDNERYKEISWLLTKDKQYTCTIILDVSEKKYGYAIFKKQNYEYENFKFKKAKYVNIDELVKSMQCDIENDM